MKTKLFCIPYSGGSATSYYKWAPYLSKEIELVPIELKGRGTRVREALYNDLEEAVKDISQEIQKKLTLNEDYMIFGHSMGSLLAYETYYELKESGSKLPKVMFFSGRNSPSSNQHKTEYYKLPDEAFLEIVYGYGENTKTLFTNKELLNFFLPILRSDFRLSERYEYQEKEEKIKCEMIVLNGEEDNHIERTEVEKWKELGDGSCRFMDYKGGHFFINQESEQVQVVSDIYSVLCDIQVK